MNCCHIAGSVLAETHFTPALLSADTSAPAQQCAIRMAARNQRANCPATAQKIAATMFTIHAMVGKRRNQINMPRLDAYSLTTNEVSLLAVALVYSVEFAIE